jgi:hypothetical protein
VNDPTASGEPGGERCSLACSLSPAALTDRRAMTGRLIARAAAPGSLIDGGIRVRFVAGSGIDAELRALVALEAECRSFLTMIVITEGRHLTLDITGPPDAMPVIRELFAMTSS